MSHNVIDMMMRTYCILYCNVTSIIYLCSDFYLYVYILYAMYVENIRDLFGHKADLLQQRNAPMARF